MGSPNNFRLVLRVKDPTPAMDWFCEKLGFARCAEENRIASGNLVFEFCSDAAAGTHHTTHGLVHVALKAADIDAALQQCLNAGLQVDCDDGKPYFNAKIWGQGTWFFNITTPCGVAIEVCQRVDLTPQPGSWNIEGLEHIGVFAKDSAATEQFYKELGFEVLYPRVANEKGPATVHCAMLGKGDCILEVYSVTGQLPFPIPENDPGIDRLLLGATAAGVHHGPQGEVIEVKPL